MRLLRTLSLAALVVSGILAIPAAAESIDPDLQRLLREAQKPKVHYGPSRVGWNGPEIPMAGAPVNPVYESLRLDSPSAIRQELKQVLLPDWQVLLALVGLIFGLRMLRTTQESAQGEPAPNVVPFPARPIPRQEAA